MNVENIYHQIKYLHWNMQNEMHTASACGLHLDLQSIFTAKIAHSIACGIRIAGLSPSDMSKWLHKCADHVDGGEKGLPDFIFHDGRRSDAVY